MGIYQSSGRTRNPLGALAVADGDARRRRVGGPVGLPVDPSGALVRSVASKLGPGFVLGDTLVLFATIFGIIAVVSPSRCRWVGGTRGDLGLRHRPRRDRPQLSGAAVVQGLHAAVAAERHNVTTVLSR